MNKKEQQAADLILEKIGERGMSPTDISLLAQAYTTIAQVGFNRTYAQPAYPIKSKYRKV